jgi:chloramphenicol-sensitive protein RarD
LAIGWLLFNPMAHSAQPEFWTTSEAIWLAMAGPVTLVPLVCFNAAARHLPYATLGFLQYIAPTLVLSLAVLMFGEHMPSATLVTFVFIWVGLIIYTIDGWLAMKRRAER